jgi:putative flippase GtrA
VLVGSVVLVVLSSVRGQRGRTLAEDARAWGLGLGVFIAAAFEWASRRGAVANASPGTSAAVAWLILCAWFVAVSLGLVTEGFASQASAPPSLRAAAARGGVARNAAAAALATAADFMLFHALLRVAPPGMATLGGCALGSVVNFSINRSWAFDSRGPLTAVAWRYAWVSGASAAVNAAAVSLALLEPSVTPSVAWLVARTLGFLAWNYPMQRDHVFGHRA